MLSRTYCASCIGIEAITVTIEVDVSQGISFFLVGLPDSAVRESQQRISTALMTIGARIPGKKIIVNYTIFL
jgi:magnesium chelatase family protein